MRVISGILRGRVFNVPKDGLRPTMGRTREAVFSSLAGRLQGARVLDLFAGSGGLGIEAWSRGAAGVTAIEKNPANWNILQENFRALESAPGLGRWQAIRADVYSFLKSESGRFDLVFADPPYGEANLPELLNVLNGALEPDGLLVFEMRSKTPFETVPGWVVIKEKVYGGSRVIFLRRDAQKKV